MNKYDDTDFQIEREESIEYKKGNDTNVGSIEETKKNIEYWENEVQEALKENDIMKAVSCRVLANNLRKDIGEEVV